MNRIIPAFAYYNPAPMADFSSFPATNTSGDVFDVAYTLEESILISLEEAGLEEVFSAGHSAMDWSFDYYDDDENAFMYFV